jgi:hypothetical protein
VFVNKVVNRRLTPACARSLAGPSVQPPHCVA